MTQIFADKKFVLSASSVLPRFFIRVLIIQINKYRISFTVLCSCFE
jgi:hypothetical protein